MERGVVVRYEYSRSRDIGRYIMLRRYGHQRLYGETVGRDSYLVVPDEGALPNRKAASVVANNAVILERGCSCNCCIHVAMRASDVRQDGTFVWDSE